MFWLSIFSISSRYHPVIIPLSSRRCGIGRKVSFVKIESICNRAIYKKLAKLQLFFEIRKLISKK